MSNNRKQLPKTAARKSTYRCPKATMRGYPVSSPRLHAHAKCVCEIIRLVSRETCRVSCLSKHTQQKVPRSLWNTTPFVAFAAHEMAYITYGGFALFAHTYAQLLHNNFSLPARVHMQYHTATSPYSSAVARLKNNNFSLPACGCATAKWLLRLTHVRGYVTATLRLRLVHLCGYAQPRQQGK